MFGKFNSNNLNNPNYPNNPMIIGGLQKFSLLDYPGQVSAIIFSQGCNFRCQFCYNPMLVWPAFAKATAGKPASAFIAEEKAGRSKYAWIKKSKQQKGHLLINEDDLFAFLKERSGKLEAVVISGGEPTIHKDLPQFIKKIKDLGYLVKLDTNGTNPGMLQKLIKEKLVDYLAMDIKDPAEKYKKITRKIFDFNKIKESVKIIMKSGLPYEFRTTIVPGLHSPEDLAEIGKIIKGADKWYLQQFKSNTNLVNQKLMGKKPYSLKEMEEMSDIGKGYAKKCEIR